MDKLEQSLVAYADGELDPVQVAAVEELIARDSALQAKVREYRETAALLRTACAENFYAEGADRLLPPARPRSWLPSRATAWALAASILMGVFGFGGGAWWARQSHPHLSARDILLDEIAEYHEVYARETKHLVEIGADRAEELYGWLGERLGRKLSAPDLSGLGLTFAGGRMFVVTSKPVAAFMYTRANGSPVAICITANENAPAPANQLRGPMRFDQHGMFRMASWEDGASTFVVVGDVPAQKLQRIASLAAAHGAN